MPMLGVMIFSNSNGLGKKITDPDLNGTILRRNYFLSYFLQEQGSKFQLVIKNVKPSLRILFSCLTIACCFFIHFSIVFALLKASYLYKNQYLF